MVFVKQRIAAARYDYAKNGVGPDDERMSDKHQGSANGAGDRRELLSRDELRCLNEWLTVDNRAWSE
jgi:hypothetical protein